MPTILEINNNKYLCVIPRPSSSSWLYPGHHYTLYDHIGFGNVEHMSSGYNDAPVIISDVIL